jgi:hypothetical protein
MICNSGCLREDTMDALIITRHCDHVIPPSLLLRWSSSNETLVRSHMYDSTAQWLTRSESPHERAAGKVTFPFPLDLPRPWVALRANQATRLSLVRYVRCNPARTPLPFQPGQLGVYGITVDCGTILAARCQTSLTHSKPKGPLRPFRQVWQLSYFL